MFGFGKRTSRDGQGPSASATDDADKAAVPAEESRLESGKKEEKTSSGSGFFARLKAGLSRTRSGLGEGLGNLLLGRKQVDEELLEDLETQLLSSDVGMDATTEILEQLRQRVKRGQLDDSAALYSVLQDIMGELLQPCDQPLVLPETSDKPFVILVIGVNGVGKTTTIGKLARRFLNDKRSVMLAAGDTFRAAAVEQLQTWGERNDVPVIAQHTGADSASVIFDAYQAASSRGVDVLIADTAGRLHNKDNLMQELQKVVRVLKKLDEDVPQETLLVLDATTGQNALSQASSFNEAVDVSGLVISKLDGTARGGMVFAIAKTLGLPLRFIGVGEQVDDLRPFNARDFIAALFERSGDTDA